MNVIDSYVSAGRFHFGVEPDDLVSVLGKPVRKDKNRLGETIVRYEGFGVTIAARGVVEVYFLPISSVSICGIDVFSDPQAFVKLCKLDGDPREYMGFIVLLNLGITMTGFHDNDESQKAITAFERGRWDHLESKLQRYLIN